MTRGMTRGRPVLLALLLVGLLPARRGGFAVPGAGRLAGAGWGRQPARPRVGRAGRPEALPEEAALNAEIYKLAREGDYKGAALRLEQALEEGAALDAVAFNAVAGAHAQAGESGEAKKWVRRMRDEGLEPDEVSYATVVEALAPVDPRGAAQWLEEMLGLRLAPSEQSYAAVIEGLGRWGDAAAAEAWTKRMAGGQEDGDEGEKPWASTFVDMIGSPELWSSRPGGDRRLEVRSPPKPLPDAPDETKGTTFGDAIVRCARRGDPARAAVWLEKMLDSGFTPTGLCYVAITEGFVEQGDVAQAAQWLDRARAAGFQLERGTFLRVLDGYASRGDTAGAAAVLQRMENSTKAQPDVKAYNAMIRSCVEGGADPEEAERWFERMAPPGLAPDLDSHTSVVLSFARQGDQESAAEWLEKTFAAGLTPNAGFMSEVASALGRASAQAELWLEAGGGARFRASGALYTALIARRARQPRREAASDATKWLEKVLAAGLTPQQGSYNAVVDAWVRQGDLDKAVAWTDRMLGAGLAPSTTTCVAVVGGLAEGGQTERAAGLLERVAAVDTKPLEAPSSALLEACVRRGDVAEVSRHLRWMASRGLATGPGRGAAVLRAAELGDLAGAAGLLEGVGAEDAPDLRAYNAVISGFARAGDAESAILWFTRMSAVGVAPDVASCASVVDAWAKKGDVEKAAEWLEKFSSSGLTLDSFSYTSIIDAFASKGDMDSAAAWLQRIVAAGLRPDQAAYNAVIKGWARRGDSGSAARWLEQMRKSGLRPNAITYATIIDACARRKDTQGCVEWHEKMMAAGEEPNRVSYNSLIGAYAKQGNTAAAAMWLQRMKEARVNPDAVSFNSLIDSCARRGDKAAARWFRQMAEEGLVPDEVSYNSLINSCAKARNYASAADWMQRMREAGLRPSVVSWSALILAHADGSEGARLKAEESFAQMVAEGVQPDSFTLRALDKSVGPKRRKELCERLLGADGAKAAAERPLARRRR